MGVNNKQRRAAKQRQRARRSSGRPQPEPGWDAVSAYGVADLEIAGTVRRLTRRQVPDSELIEMAARLARRLHPIPSHVHATVLGDLLSRLIDGVVRGGWGPADLRELVHRCADPRHRPTLAAVLHEDARRHDRGGRVWRTAIDEIGPETRLRLGSTDEFASALRVAALLAVAPLLEAGAVAGPTAAGSEHPKLAQVRALLAKAESTDYDEEAEALSAKAQELISRYALGRLVDQSQHDESGTDLRVRRIWLDAPYVQAKASLVNEVASANRCQAACTERLGFCVVVGAAADIDAVELLVTSLLVQASTAMVRHGRRFDESGVPRTRSFRQSFLMAYATGIGRRLRSATDSVAAEDDGRLLPVLRDHETRVSDAFEAMVPHTVRKSTRISNGEGWAAGLAAADLALLDVNGKITERTG